MTRKHPYALLFLSALFAWLAISQSAGAQTSYNRFGPATGILVGDSTTYYTTAAAASNVTGLWSGTCNSGSFLRGDGVCATPSGTGVTSVGLTVPSGLSVSGSPVTSSGTLAISTTLNGPVRGNGSGLTTGATALGSEVSGTLPVANGGTGVTSSTGTGSVVLSASPTLTGTTTVATLAATAATVGGSAVCRLDGTDCPAGGGDATLAGTQTFSGQNTFSRNRGAAGEYAMVWQSNQPSTLWYENDGAANEKGWRVSADSGALLHYAMNDADTSGAIWMQVDRTATAIDSVTFAAPVIATIQTGNITGFRANNNGTNDAEILVNTSTAGNAYVRTTNVGGQNWSFGNDRTSGNFAIANGVGVASPLVVLTTGGALSASASFVPDADLGANLGTSSLRFGEVHSISYCEGDCASTEFVDSTGTTARFGNGSTWTAINLPRTTTVSAASSPSMNVDDLSGVSTASVRMMDNGTPRALFGVSNGTSQCITGDSANDACIRAESGAIRFSVNGGTSSAVAISSSGQVVVAGSVVSVGGVTLPRTAYAFVQSNGAITGGGITAVGITSVTNGSTGNYTVNFTGSFFSSAPACTASAGTSLLGARAQVANASTSSVVAITNDNTGAASNQAFNIICTGPG